MTIRGDELDLAANYLANKFGRGSSRIVLQPGVLSLAASVEVPANPLGRYVNVQALLRETGGLPAVEELRIGRLPVPGFVADWALAHALKSLDRTNEYQVAADTLKSVSIADGSLRVVYEWRDDLPARVGGVLLAPADRERMKAYQERLAQWSRDAGSARGASLAEVLRPLMQVAAERARSGDAQAESRALIAVVTFYVNGKGLAAIVPEAKDWAQPVPRKVTLNGRTDSPQHFTISAALAAHAGSPLSDAIGLYREVDDSRRGSGFSFNDLAADRAGTRFGELATRSAGERAATAAAHARRDFGSRTSCRTPRTCRNSCRRPSSSVASAASERRPTSARWTTSSGASRRARCIAEGGGFDDRTPRPLHVPAAGRRADAGRRRPSRTRRRCCASRCRTSPTSIRSRSPTCTPHVSRM